MQFSEKYHEDQFPERYAGKHDASASRRFNNRREQQLLRRCLAWVGPVDSVADIGCGAGRFWRTLLDASGVGTGVALDVSEAMLQFARRSQPPALGERFRPVAGSALALPFGDGAFDCVISMRLLHHFGEPEPRRQALSELARVARRAVIVSLWTDGNFKAWRRRRLEAVRGQRAYQNRHVVPRAQLAADFEAAGLTPATHFDLLPGYSQWRYYVLVPVAR